MAEEVGAKARKQEVHSAPRPVQLGRTSEDIAEEVRRVRDTADTWKVYRQEWIIVFASRQGGDEGRKEAESHFLEKYDGRVRAEDVTYRPMFEAKTSKWYLLLNLWNQRGEWKHRHLAELQRTDLLRKYPDADIRVVGRNSRDETLLKEYSKKKLVTVMGAPRE